MTRWTTLPLALIFAIANGAAAQDASRPGEVSALPSSGTTLPHDLSLAGMIGNASPVAQAVIVALTLASIVTWTIWLAQTLDLVARRRAVSKLLGHLAERPSLEIVTGGMVHGDAARLASAATSELARSGPKTGAQGLLDRLSLAFERIEAAVGRSRAGWIGLVGTIGATAPFVGLFGTVWGIMNSFIGISLAHTTNLAVVAPGIAEALLTTALGLFAAIPAVIFYNLLTRSLSAYRGVLGDLAAELLRIVSRDFDRAEREP
jgi:biopolymer transport protein ExbB